MRGLIIIAIACACGDAEQTAPVVAPTVSVAALPPVSDASCATGEYVSEPASSAAAANLPTPPTLPSTPIKIGDAFTVFGARHTLRDPYRMKELDAPITIVGVIVDTNLARAPKCALHRTGVADPAGCVAEIPSFAIADDASGATRIRVLGWASNFANVFDAFMKYDKLTQMPAHLAQDELWATDIPFPLPAIGAKVKVTGRYNASFQRASSGILMDDRNGIMTMSKVEVLTPATTRAHLPQIGR